MMKTFSEASGPFRRLSVLVVFLAVWVSSAQATTLSFEDHMGGTDLGGVSGVILDAGAVSDGIEITLTNTGAYAALIGKLTMSYAGQESDIRLAASPDTRAFRFGGDGTSPISVAMGTISLEFWGRDMPLAAIRPGESFGFTLLGASMSDLFVGRHGAIISLFTEEGGRSRYAAVPLAEAPLPAAGLMLLAALGLLGAARRRMA